MPIPFIALAADHAGYELKNILKEDLRAAGHEVIDLGTNDPQSVDYADYAYALGSALKGKDDAVGVLICGTGIGISIAANRQPHIRAALVHDALSARLARQHNNANVIAMGARLIGVELARDNLRAFLETEFLGGRHADRIAKLASPPVSSLV
jgi:ribose 5-phosphate isomerase B